MTVARIGPGRFRVGIASGEQVQTVDAELERFDEHTGRIVVNGQRYRLVSDTHGPVHLVEVDGVTCRISRDEGGAVRSPAPALVVATPVEVGAEVEAGAPVLVLESMKMETVLRAPFRARLRECLVSVGSQVQTGTPLLRLEPLGGDAAEAGRRGRRRGPRAAARARRPWRRSDRLARGLEELRGLLLGFDVDPRDEAGALARYLAARAELEHRPLGAEVELVQVFADLSELSRNRAAGEETRVDTRVHSPREFFHTYLQSLDVERAGLPGDLPEPAGEGPAPLRRR